MSKKKIVIFISAVAVIAALQWGLSSRNNTIADNGTTLGAATQRPESQPTAGNTAIHHTDMQQELDKLVDMIDKHPKSAKLYAERSTIFMMMEHPGQALSDIETAVDLEPDNAEYLTNRAMAYRKFERLNDAMEDLNKAIALDPNLLAAYFNRGVIYFGLKKFDKAVEDFTTCVEAHPDIEQPLFNRAFSYEQLGQLDKAKADLKKFLDVTENHDARILAETKLKEWDKVDYKTILEGEKFNHQNPH